MYDSSLSFVHCFQCTTTTTGWLSNSSKKNEKVNQVEGCSGSSVGLVVASLAVSTSETSSVVCSGIVGFELLIGSSVGGGVGDFIVGEFRCCCCCSSSYSLIKRFLSECALFDETDAVGDVDDEIGDVAIGGLLTFDGWSTFMDNDDSCWVSDEGVVCWVRRVNFPFGEWSSGDVDDCLDGENCGSFLFI